MSGARAPEAPAPDPTRGGRSPDRRRAWARAAAVALVTLAIVYGFRLADQLVATHRAQRAEEDLAAEVGLMSSEVSALRTAAAEAQSDTSVETWAREERGWAREGDQVLVVAAPTATPIAPVTAKGQQDPGVWERWTLWLRRALRR